MRILHLLVGHTVGGVEGQLLQLLPRLQKKGVINSVGSLKGAGPLTEAFHRVGIRTFSLGGQGKWDGRVLPRLYGLLRRERVDLMHCYTTLANWAGAVAGRLVGVPRILLSDREVRVWMHGWQRRVDRLCFRCAHGMTVPSEAVLIFDRDRLGLPAKRIFVTPNGVDLDRFSMEPSKGRVRQGLGISAAVPVVGYVGRLDEPVKGVRHLLAAFAILRGEGVDFRGLVVGGGHSRGTLQHQTKILGLNGQVLFVGTRGDIPLVMRALDLLVLPSILEGSPNVILEAMAARVPVVATAVGGVPELIQNRETGVLVPPRDPQALAREVIQLLRHPQEAQAMAERARRWVEAHRSMEKTADLIEELYKRLLAQDPQGASS